ncbi:hypothetical protein HU200_004651 [Digitaria exilis]|uniref:At1g61320/AtMIF1 LRR domain-containing protein n=1 Tax=Digitaria exilis TaxID=1010633 RepID=A0A835FUC3_9POAL|nr:hypothetical protein HU200_004651 [Digitaria exilis]
MQDIWWHIHSLMPVRYAAQVACMSQDFRHSWRYHPNLTFSEETLGLNGNVCGKDDKTRYFTDRVDNILKKHSGIGMEELNLSVSSMNEKYNFPCTLLSGGVGDSLRRLVLVACDFYPTESCCLRSLTRLKLYAVHILEDNLMCLFSNTCALEWLELRQCNSIIHLKIPCLQKLSYLGVSFCFGLQLIESKAPNLCSFSFAGGRRVQLSLGDTLRIKKLNRSCINAALYARTELPSSMPNLETLTLCSDGERLNTPMMPSRFLHLRFLCITICGVAYDLLSLVSFFHASPSLETFILSVSQHPSYPSGLRMMHEHQYDKLKSVQIINFSSNKSLVELTCHILKSATCSVSKSGKCLLMRTEALVEARRAALAIQTYIQSKVPSAVELNVLEPCSQCHAEL